MTENRRNEPATEPQKDKLRFFGCTWDDGITAGQATDALKECAKLFPDREAAWQMQKTECPKNPETFPVEAFEKLDATISEEVTIQKAEIVETKPTPAAAPAFIPPSPEPQSKIEAPPHEVPIQTAKSLSAQPSARHEGFFSGTAERRRDANLSNNQLENAASDAQDSAAIKAHYSPQTDSYTFVPIYSTSEQLNAIRAYGKQPPKGLTFTEAEKLLEQCKILHLIKLRADILRRATIQKAETAAGQPSVRREGFFSGESQPETRKTEAASCQSTKEWDEWFALLGQIKKWAIPFGDLAAQEVTIQEVATAATQPGARHEDEETGVYSPKVQDLIAQLKNPDKHARDRAAIELGRSKNPLAVKPLISSLEDDHWGTGVHAAEALGELGFPDAVEPLVESLKSSELYVRATAAKALGKIKDTRAIAALSLTLKDPSEFVRKAAHEALSKIRGDARIPPPQISAQRPASNQPALIPTWQSVDDLLTGWPSSDGCYWLPVKVAATLVGIIAETKLTNAQSRQIANQIEWNRYCFEPDARYGGGTYDIDQTLVVFKPFAGDQVNPSPAYLGAANLLRLCVLIAAADGQIDEVELDVFRQIIENQLDLTPTDHRRLQVLEKLLVQDPSSAAKTLASVAKSIPAHKRLLIGKVLVRVAAADTVITKDERRALERIFKAFEIPQDTLEKLMLQACPPSQAEVVQKTAPISIQIKPDAPKESEAELTRMKEWAEWVALQERIAERQKITSRKASLQKDQEGGISEQLSELFVTVVGDCLVVPESVQDLHFCELPVSVRLGHILEQIKATRIGDLNGVSISELKNIKNCGNKTISEIVSLIEKAVAGEFKTATERIAAPVSKSFMLDEARVYEITSETKEVVAMLSVLMADEPQATVTPSQRVEMSAPEIPQVSGGDKSAPQPSRFGGLNVAFIPILDRLLARDSWPPADFNALAREFQFMPLNIRDTLNEWSDEALGDFILDGEDPVFVRRELMAKEQI